MRFENWDRELIKFISLHDLEMLNNQLSTAMLAGVLTRRKAVNTAVLLGKSYFIMEERKKPFLFWLSMSGKTHVQQQGTAIFLNFVAKMVSDMHMETQWKRESL